MGIRSSKRSHGKTSRGEMAKKFRELRGNLKRVHSGGFTEITVPRWNDKCSGWNSRYRPCSNDRRKLVHENDNLKQQSPSFTAPAAATAAGDESHTRSDCSGLRMRRSKLMARRPLSTLREFRWQLEGLCRLGMKMLFSDSNSWRSTTTKPLSRPESLHGHHEDRPNQVGPSSSRFGLECTASRASQGYKDCKAARVAKGCWGEPGSPVMDVASGRSLEEHAQLRDVNWSVACTSWKCLVRKVLIHIAGWARSLLLFSGRCCTEWHVLSAVREPVVAVGTKFFFA